ncbi:hypothetical protein KJI95_11130 [Shewanella sp. JM162201]|uniref:Uncharacterized protein n=1 Tax=Shewanella jiangmenensis TaxID=2837387 RepID=A0ABS5V3P4_9GAMM|nr:hypothetical protein [Shewanella jiangmenensis]MBT1445072.1 hypothetical protein [Shewanella jiangmenensis]
MPKGLSISLGLLLISLPLLLNLLMQHFNLLYRFELQSGYSLPEAIKDLLMLGALCGGISLCVSSARARRWLYFFTLSLFGLSMLLSANFSLSRYQADYLEQADTRFQFERIDGGAFTTRTYLNLWQLKPVTPLFYRYCAIDSYEGFREGTLLAVTQNRLTLKLTNYNNKSIQVTAAAECAAPL